MQRLWEPHNPGDRLVVAEARQMNDVYVPRLLKRYKEEVVSGLREQFGYTNDMAVPRLVKAVVNMGLGRAVQERKRLQDGMRDLAALTGQKPLVTKAGSRWRVSRFGRGWSWGARLRCGERGCMSFWTG